MNSGLLPSEASHSRTRSARISAPLSLRTCSGTPWRQRIFVDAPERLIALCPARLVHQAARPPFADALLAGVLDGFPAPFGT